MSFFVNLILIHLSRMFLLLYFYLTWFLFVFFFFFFNDTATTEIYTLSLHDALPISIVRAVRWFHPRLSILHFDAHPDLDRKSTRLNSSHSQISYAVFCLKKKKKTKHSITKNSNICVQSTVMPMMSSVLCEFTILDSS